MQERHVEGADHICASLCPTFFSLAGDVSPLTTVGIQVEVCPRGFSVPSMRKGAAHQKLAQERDVPCLTNGSWDVLLPLAVIVCRVE